jgi:hypothetical protein
MKELSWLKLPEREEDDPYVKPEAYLAAYEEYLGHLRRERFALLEMGIYTAASLEMWRDAFPLATIVGVDLNPPKIDLGPRVHLVTGDQSDSDVLSRVRADYAPDGFTVVIDDASHLGVLSARSLQGLYEHHLQEGGLYIIEDWGTGYMLDWPDGGAAEFVDVAQLDVPPEAKPTPDGLTPSGTSLPSHDLGMVGLTKRLVDHVAAPDLRHFSPNSVGNALAIDRMVIQHGLVVLQKPRGSS